MGFSRNTTNSRRSRRRPPINDSPVNRDFNHVNNTQYGMPEQGNYGRKEEPIQENGLNGQNGSGTDTQDSGKKKSWTALRYICIAVGVILAVLFLIKAGQIIVSGIGPAIQSFKAVMNVVFHRFVEALIGAVVIYLLASTLLGRLLPQNVKTKIIPVCVILLLLYSIAPALSTAIGELLTIVVGFIILITVLR